MRAGQLVAFVPLTVHANATADPLLQWVDIELTNVVGSATRKGTGMIHLIDDD